MVRPRHPVPAVTLALAAFLVFQVNGSVLPANNPDRLITGNPRTSSEVHLNKDVLNQLLQRIFPSASQVDVDTGEVIQVVRGEVADTTNTGDEPRQITVGNLNVDLSKLRKLPSQQSRVGNNDNDGNRQMNETPQDLYTSQQRAAPRANPAFSQPQEQFSRQQSQQVTSQQYAPQQSQHRSSQLYQGSEVNRAQLSPPQQTAAQTTYKQPAQNTYHTNTQTQQSSVQQQYQQAFAQQRSNAAESHQRQIYGQQPQQMSYQHQAASSTDQGGSERPATTQGRRIQVGEISFTPVS